MKFKKDEAEVLTAELITLMVGMVVRLPDGLELIETALEVVKEVGVEVSTVDSSEPYETSEYEC